jgi:hypothetical protein
MTIGTAPDPNTRNRSNNAAGYESLITIRPIHILLFSYNRRPSPERLPLNE